VVFHGFSGSRFPAQRHFPCIPRAHKMDSQAGCCMTPWKGKMSYAIADVYPSLGSAWVPYE
jgi:hypothetical protein